MTIEKASEFSTNLLGYVEVRAGEDMSLSVHLFKAVNCKPPHLTGSSTARRLYATFVIVPESSLGTPLCLFLRTKQNGCNPVPVVITVAFNGIDQLGQQVNNNLWASHGNWAGDFSSTLFYSRRDNVIEFGDRNVLAYAPPETLHDFTSLDDFSGTIIIRVSHVRVGGTCSEYNRRHPDEVIIIKCVDEKQAGELTTALTDSPTRFNPETCDVAKQD